MLRAEYFMYCKQFEYALNVFKYLLKYCKHEEKPNEALKVFFNIGTWYRLSKDHLKAKNILKKVLQKAWINDNKELELKVYELLGYEHYYLGNIEKSKYYCERYQRGILEAKNSVIRNVYIQDLYTNTTYGNVYKDVIDENQYLLEDDKQLLPSPSEVDRCHIGHKENDVSSKRNNTLSLFNSLHAYKKKDEKVYKLLKFDDPKRQSRSADKK